jgi:hypothetical protein
MKRSANQNISLICLGVVLMWIGFDPTLTPWGDNLPFFHVMAHFVLFAGATFFTFGLESIRRITIEARQH